ncbi:MAG: tRNA pseudouridine(38-40) synthase TruA [Actinomycetota bacterium]|nr:tRNA pseudouridine(38-40) synthase TruA [Actinomycetota bacterium]
MRVRLLVAYDGAPYSGFAANPGVRTVAGTLAEVLERVLGHPVELTCAGRTDKGVHAWGQVVSFDTEPQRFDADGLTAAVNRLCGPSIVVRDASLADEGFDARFSARWRRYRYTILNDPVPDPFLAATAWHVARPLDLAALRLGCDPLIGEHDFSSFCRRPKPAPGAEEPSLVRRVLRARWDRVDERVLRFEITASSFCHQMVRSVVGTLVDMGSGRLKPGEMRSIITARDRAVAGQPAPPHGLCLWEVGYDDPRLAGDGSSS